MVYSMAIYSTLAHNAYDRENMHYQNYAQLHLVLLM